MTATNLNAASIYEKVFSVENKGYKPLEVDEYLDLVIEDYRTFEDQIDEMKNKIAEYENKVKELEQQIALLSAENGNLKEQEGAADAADAASADQLDLLKRIARLEEAVFKKEN